MITQAQAMLLVLAFLLALSLTIGISIVALAVWYELTDRLARHRHTHHNTTGAAR